MATKNTTDAAVTVRGGMAKGLTSIIPLVDKLKPGQIKDIFTELAKMDLAAHTGAVQAVTEITQVTNSNAGVTNSNAGVTNNLATNVKNLTETVNNLAPTPVSKRWVEVVGA